MLCSVCTGSRFQRQLFHDAFLSSSLSRRCFSDNLEIPSFDSDIPLEALSRNHSRTRIGGVSWIPARPRIGKTKAWERGRRFDSVQNKMIYPTTPKDQEVRPNTPAERFETAVRWAVKKKLPADSIHKVLRQAFEEHYDLITGSRRKAIVFIEDKIKQGSTAYAFDLVQIAYQLGNPFRLKDFEKMAYQLSLRGNWDLVETITDIGHQTTGGWSTRLLDWALKAYLQTRNFARAGNVLEEYKRYNLSPTRRTFHLLIRTHLKNSDLSNARQALHQMKAAGFEPNKRTFDSILSAYTALGVNPDVEMQAAQSLQNSGDRTETSIMNNLLRSRIADGDVEGAFRLLELADFSSKRALQSPGTENVIDPNGFLDSKARLIRPNVDTFNALLTALAEQGDTERFFMVYRLMKSVGCPANERTVQAILKNFANNDQVTIAVSIVFELCRRHYPNITKQRFDIFGQIEDVQQLLNEEFPWMLSLTPSIGIFNTFLNIALPYAKLHGLLRVLRIFQTNDIQPDTATIDIVLHHLNKVHNMEPQAVLYSLQVLSSFPSYKSSVTIKHLNAVLSCCIRHELSIVKARSWFSSSARVRFGHRSRFNIERSSMSTSYFDPTAGIAVFSFSARNIARHILVPLARILRERGALSTRYTFALRIRREAIIKRDLQTAREIFDIMASRGITPDVYHYSHLIEGYAAIGAMADARHIMELAYSNAIKPNIIFYTLLILGWGQLGKPQEALNVFREMLAANVPPDFVVLDAVVSCYFMVGAYRAARNLLMDIWPLVAPLPPDFHTTSLRDLVLLLRSYRSSKRDRLTSSQESRQRGNRRRLLENVVDEVQSWQISASRSKAALRWDYILHRGNSNTDGEEGE